MNKKKFLDPTFFRALSLLMPRIPVVCSAGKPKPPKGFFEDKTIYLCALAPKQNTQKLRKKTRHKTVKADF